MENFQPVIVKTLQIRYHTSNKKKTLKNTGKVREIFQNLYFMTTVINGILYFPAQFGLPFVVLLTGSAYENTCSSGAEFTVTKNYSNFDNLKLRFIFHTLISYVFCKTFANLSFTILQGYTQAVDEDTATSTVLLTVAATDGDSADTVDGQIKYSLPSNPAEFEIKYVA